ncbi:hypothetical protein [Brumimicrobium salinarum]|nr:hypothetical protein [Brumimicrobium salinarum]
MASAEREEERQAKVASLLKDIRSGEEKSIIEALKALKVNGDDQVIKPIIKVWNAGVSDLAEQEIITFLGDIKSTTSADTLMSILLDTAYNAIHLPLLTTIWNSKVDYSEYIVEFVNLAVKHDFMVSLECLTIIENMEGPFEEHHILDAEILLREYVDREKDNQNVDDKKFSLILELSKLINSFDERTM